ncbi:MAG: hypothetical protein AAF495_22440 [Pseudomonadota bacterium]
MRLPQSLGAVAAIALMLVLANSGTATADTPAKATSAKSLAGTYYNLPADRSCTETAGSVVCNYAIDGIGTSSEGEVYSRKIIGTSHGKIAVPGDQAQNRSYVIWGFADGSQLTMESEGVTVMGKDGTITTSGRQVCVEGSGRFADVDCAIDWANKPAQSGLTPGSYHGSMTPRSQT